MQDQSSLTSAEKKELRGFAQRLKPHVHLGKKGLTETALAEINTALQKNELIKVRFETERESMQNHIVEIAEKLDCEFVGGVGKVGIFYRKLPEEESA